ncbi:MAG: serine/threonine protein kinase [Acidobacteria bacterium]|nr:serine/threonine protein kinase [Acidobacteriota bacterium]
MTTKTLDPSRLESLLESTELLHSSQDLSEMLRHLLRTVMGRLLVSRGLIAVITQANMEVIIVKGTSKISAGTMFSLEQAKNVGMNLIFSIGVKENPIGYLALGQPASENILKDEEGFINSLLGIAASVIKNARAHSQTIKLNRELEQKIQELRAILDFVRGLSSTLDATEIAQLLVLTLSGGWAVKKYALAIWREPQKPLLRQKGINLPSIEDLKPFLKSMSEAIKLKELPDSELKENLLKENVEILFPIPILSATNIINDVSCDTVASLSVDSNVIGVLAFGSRPGKLTYSDSDIDFGVGVVAQAAIALQNAWYFQDAVERQKMEARFQAEQRANIVFSAFSDVLTGAVLDGKYQLNSKIGAGGFGVVYKATHLDLARTVAIKILRPIIGSNARERLERFRQEGISACRINHPNAVSILDFVISTNGIAYLVMELLNGFSLGDEIKKQGRLSLARSAEILAPVCDVLDQVHSLGMVHRDIKPDNIFLHQTPQGEIVKVVDFGLTKIFTNDSESDNSNLSNAGEVLGTPAYMSPERFGSLSYDGKTDVYSLGLVTYEMLTGELPFVFNERTPYRMAMVHIQERPRPLRQLNSAIAENIEKVVMQTLRKSPSKRPTIKEFAQNFIELVKKLTPEESSRVFFDDGKIFLGQSKENWQDSRDSKTDTLSIKITKIDSMP